MQSFKNLCKSRFTMRQKNTESKSTGDEMNRHRTDTQRLMIDFFKKIGFYSKFAWSQGITATARHGVTRKRWRKRQKGYRKAV